MKKMELYQLILYRFISPLSLLKDRKLQLQPTKLSEKIWSFVTKVSSRPKETSWTILLTCPSLNWSLISTTMNSYWLTIQTLINSKPWFFRCLSVWILRSVLYRSSQKLKLQHMSVQTERILSLMKISSYRWWVGIRGGPRLQESWQREWRREKN